MADRTTKEKTDRAAELSHKITKLVAAEIEFSGTIPDEAIVGIALACQTMLRLAWGFVQEGTLAADDFEHLRNGCIKVVSLDSWKGTVH